MTSLMTSGKARYRCDSFISCVENIEVYTRWRYWEPVCSWPHGQTAGSQMTGWYFTPSSRKPV